MVTTERSGNILDNQGRDANIVPALAVFRDQYLAGFQSKPLYLLGCSSRFHEGKVSSDPIVVINIGVITKSHPFFSFDWHLIDVTGLQVYDELRPHRRPSAGQRCIVLRQNLVEVA